uniref:ATP synthase complex subunit 8 n=1 Tax=Eriosoma harunire TaxID=1308590 RepID=A0A096VKB6_9HEMI|nr:ATP synthase F0 subunit 8 [Eriosoma harunire]AHK17975.1 F-ATPase subunit 8 [Eriosoma harunire]
MPQMAPMNWLILFIYFLMMFYIIMNLMYFNFFKLFNNHKNNEIKLKMKNYNKLI